MTDPLLPFVAVVAGFISFSSPCCLPLVPGYLSYMSSLPMAELGEREARRVTLRAALLFVAGFTLVFTVLGVGASVLGQAFARNQDTLTRWFGVAIVVMGLSTLGVLRIPVLQRERRLDLARIPRGPCAERYAGLNMVSRMVADTLQITRPRRSQNPATATSWTPLRGLQIRAVPGAPNGRTGTPPAGAGNGASAAPRRLTNERTYQTVQIACRCSNATTARDGLAGDRVRSESIHFPDLRVTRRRGINKSLLDRESVNPPMRLRRSP